MIAFTNKNCRAKPITQFENMNRHSSLLAACAAIALLLPSCASRGLNESVVPSEKMTEIAYSQAGFNSVSADMQAKVDITTGEEFSVTASVPENLSDYFIVRKEGNALIISCKSVQLRQVTERNTPVIRVTLPELAGLTASDQCSVSVSGNVAAGFTLRCSDQSAAAFRNDISANTMTLTALGQSSVSAGNIAAQNITIITEDQSSVAIDNLKAATGTVDASDQSSLSVQSGTGDIKVRTSDQASCSIR